MNTHRHSTTIYRVWLWDNYVENTCITMKGKLIAEKSGMVTWYHRATSNTLMPMVSPFQIYNVETFHSVHIETMKIPYGTR